MYFFSKTKNKKSWIKKNLWNRRHGSWLFCWFGLCWARCQGWTAVTWLLRPWCTLTTTLHHSHWGCKKKECVLVRLVGLHSRRHPRTQNTPSHPHFQVQGVPPKKCRRYCSSTLTASPTQPKSTKKSTSMTSISQVPLGSKELFFFFFSFLAWFFLKSGNFFCGNTVSRSHPLRSKNAGWIAYYYYYYSVSTPALHHSIVALAQCTVKEEAAPSATPGKKLPGWFFTMKPLHPRPNTTAFSANVLTDSCSKFFLD